METTQIKNLALIGDELALAWSDGQESYFNLATLRKACPCANCQGEPDALGRVIRPTVTHGPRAYELVSWEIVGGYALQLRWGDGHATGLYTFSYLRSLTQEPS
ncbi:DUF971 domain-containing protein [Roseibacillus ishigakijimensis]|uniref:DUF971 domain-containing protein n=1 Tax=Roseibacillus ishigakijimensis TaxID=454146 RepID=A0A934RSK4_9BACT|nr:DUF971 domain-containing protein [Roseibacillus ishigakijimensis]MBK1834881.1 DUF971 domain-containing protein [Roseibacillus ishigakijimensis]